MKNGVVCNIPVTEGEVTIVKAANANEIMKHSCEIAIESRKAGAGVLIVNTGLSKRRFKEAATAAGIEWMQSRNANAIVSEGDVPLVIQTMVAGELASQLEGIRNMCEEADIKVLVITGWEWTSSSYSRKEKLLYGLRTMLDDLDISVIVYTQSPNPIVCGNYSRGGVGKLAMMAYQVIDLEEAKLTDESETDLGELVGAPKQQPIFAKVEQLSTNKINDLQTIFTESSDKKHERVFAKAA